MIKWTHGSIELVVRDLDGERHGFPLQWMPVPNVSSQALLYTVRGVKLLREDEEGKCSPMNHGLVGIPAVAGHN